MTTDPVDEPPSTDRRKLLLALGFGGVNFLVLRLFGGAPSATVVTNRPETGVLLETTQPSVAGPTVGTGRQASILPPPLSDALPPPNPKHRFDVAIIGGRLIDPDSGFDGIANIGIDGSTITSITRSEIRGREVIEATGLVVAPGFIDLLSYEPNSFGSWLKLADGVTTNLAMHGVNNYAPAFFSRYENTSPIHFGGAFHHHFMRGFDLGIGVEDEAGLLHEAEMERLARKNIGEGFAGISFSPEYSPGTSTSELERLANMAAGLGHVGFFHVRYSDPDGPGTSLEAIQEVLRIATRTGVSVHIEHLSSTGGTFVMERALGMIERARGTGVDVTACVYPYNFWGTFLGSPRFSLGWQERYRLTESDLQIAGTNERLTKATFGMAQRENKLVAALGSIPEEEIQMALRQEWVMVASDAIVTGTLNNHPRGAGTFARTIGRYVRDLGVLSLIEGLAKMTILPARRVETMIPAMVKKGRLQRGADADIVIFDPATIKDRATVESPAQPSSGIEWVLVDGNVSLREGEPDRSVLAGQPLRSAIVDRSASVQARDG